MVLIQNQDVNKLTRERVNACCGGGGGGGGVEIVVVVVVVAAGWQRRWQRRTAGWQYNSGYFFLVTVIILSTVIPEFLLYAQYLAIRTVKHGSFTVLLICRFLLGTPIVLVDSSEYWNT